MNSATWDKYKQQGLQQLAGMQPAQQAGNIEEQQ